VVSVVLVLPPLDRVALHQVAPEETKIVAVLALLEDLVVQKVVCQPAALLVEQTEEESCSHVNSERVTEVHHSACCRPDGHVAETLVYSRTIRCS
jgi:hypothetical protein